MADPPVRSKPRHTADSLVRHRSTMICAWPSTPNRSANLPQVHHSADCSNQHVRQQHAKGASPTIRPRTNTPHAPNRALCPGALPWTSGQAARIGARIPAALSCTAFPASLPSFVVHVKVIFNSLLARVVTSTISLMRAQMASFHHVTGLPV